MYLNLLFPHNGGHSTTVTIKTIVKNKVYRIHPQPSLYTVT